MRQIHSVECFRRIGKIDIRITAKTGKEYANQEKGVFKLLLNKSGDTEFLRGISKSCKRNPHVIRNYLSPLVQSVSNWFSFLFSCRWGLNVNTRWRNTSSWKKRWEWSKRGSSDTKWFYEPAMLRVISSRHGWSFPNFPTLKSCKKRSDKMWWIALWFIVGASLSVLKINKNLLPWLLIWIIIAIHILTKLLSSTFNCNC